jgi:hypothetical protein
MYNSMLSIVIVSWIHIMTRKPLKLSGQSIHVIWLELSLIAICLELSIQVLVVDDQCSWMR